VHDPVTGETGKIIGGLALRLKVAIPIVRSEANALAKAIMASGRRWLLSPSTSYVAATRLWPQ